MQSVVRVASLALIYSLVGESLVSRLDAQQIENKVQRPEYSVSPEIENKVQPPGYSVPPKGDEAQEFDRLREGALPSKQLDIGVADPIGSGEVQLRQEPDFEEAVPLRALRDVPRTAVDPDTFVTEVTPDSVDDRLRLEGLPLSQTEVEIFVGKTGYPRSPAQNAELLSTLRSMASERRQDASDIGIVTSLDRPPDPSHWTEPEVPVEKMPLFQRNVAKVLRETGTPGPLRVFNGRMIEPDKDQFPEAVMIVQGTGAGYEKCSGVLLAPTVVLSAAHCLCGMPEPIVIFGTHSVLI